MDEIVIDLGRLTIADYPDLTRVVQAVLKNPESPEVSTDLIALLDRVVEGGVSTRPMAEFHAIRLAFVKAAAELLRPKALRAGSGSISGSRAAPAPLPSSGSRSN